MKLLATTALLTVVACMPAAAQTATGIGVGTSKATAVSKSAAIAQSGTGGTANQNLTLNQNTPADQTIKNVPTAFAPGLAAAGLETCLGSVSGGGSFVGTGFSFGGTIPDPGCATRLDARTLWSMGLKKAAVARLCLNPDINRSMPDVCQRYLPQVIGVPVPVAVPVGYAEPVAAPGYISGDIWLVDGNTGKDRLCKDYNAPGQKCRHWAGDLQKKKILAARIRKPVVADPIPAKPMATTEPVIGVN